MATITQLKIDCYALLSREYKITLPYTEDENDRELFLTQYYELRKLLMQYLASNLVTSSSLVSGNLRQKASWEAIKQALLDRNSFVFLGIKLIFRYGIGRKFINPIINVDDYEDYYSIQTVTTEENATDKLTFVKNKVANLYATYDNIPHTFKIHDGKQYRIANYIMKAIFKTEFNYTIEHYLQLEYCLEYHREICEHYINTTV